MTKITPELVLRLNRRHPEPQVAATKLQMAADKFGINTPRRVAMFLAQLTHESGLIPVQENLNYSARRLTQVWPNRFPTMAIAERYAYNPVALADKVYSGRMGNGEGEGHLYIGRGFIQITGKYNYERYGKQIGYDLVAHPELACQYGVGALVAGAYWVDANCNALSDSGNVAAVTKAINGGFIGLSDREALYQRSLNAIPRYGLLETDPPLDFAGDAAKQLEARTALFEELASLA